MFLGRFSCASLSFLKIVFALRVRFYYTVCFNFYRVVHLIFLFNRIVLRKINTRTYDKQNQIQILFFFSLFIFSLFIFITIIERIECILIIFTRFHLDANNNRSRIYLSYFASGYKSRSEFLYILPETFISNLGAKTDDVPFLSLSASLFLSAVSRVRAF